MNNDDAVNFFKRLIQPLRDRVLLMVGRAVLTAIKNGSPIQEVQLTALAGEDMTKISRYQEYGFTSVPPAGTEAIIVSVGGSRSNAVVIATDNRELRPTDWAEGESGLYNADGMVAVLKTGGKLKVANEAEDLVTVLSDLVQWLLESARVITIMGPQPFTPDTVLLLQEIKTRLDTFKV